MSMLAWVACIGGSLLTAGCSLISVPLLLNHCNL